MVFARELVVGIGENKLVIYSGVDFIQMVHRTSI